MISRRKVKETVAGYLFCLPAILLFLSVGLYSVLFSVFLSFHNWAGVDFAGTARFVGLDNFRYFLFGGSAINTRIFFLGLFNNIRIGFFTIFFVIPIALGLAFMVTNTKRSGALRTVYFLPLVASGVGIFYVWRGLFGAFGFLNRMFSALGLEFLVVREGLLGNPRTAIIGVIITTVWAGIPGTMILYYAGLASIDETLYEAAEIDGASKVKTLWYITWPLLKPITIIIIIHELNKAFQMFENIWVLTGGGPGGATDVVGTLVFKNAFELQRYGLATAMGWSVFVLTLGLSLLSMKLFRSETN